VKISTSIWLATGLLLLRAAMLDSSQGPEYVPEMPPLTEFPLSVGDWRFYQEGVIDEETRDFLKADDLRNRIYVKNGNQRGTNLFVAAFRTLTTGAPPIPSRTAFPVRGGPAFSLMS